MAGRIRDEDVALVRERARIDEVVSDHVTLRNAGAGSMKGLCPFHDEKSPSFHVTPARGFFHCFGCQEGGDVITFVQKIEGVGFTEAVERLATRFGVELHYAEDGFPSQRPDRGQRTRLIDAHRAAAAFYTERLSAPDALAGRQFLAERGFDKDAADLFGIGYAPRDGDALLKHLRNSGFRDDELVTSGLIGRGQGLYDRFRGRLLWPIREISGDVVGFGARRLYDDDRIEAKYLNTPETPIYKKSQLLYGADLARKAIARSSQAVVVEGYTDVMACHLSGVETAVATCGTAFGDDHARILRRLLLDNNVFRGSVIFTFDGDEAGQKAALRAFEGDQEFVGQTYVAVEPDGLDPCDLRMRDGDAAVRELIARQEPLYRFVLRNVIDRYDLDRADSRVDAVRAAAKLVVSVRDDSKVSMLVRELSRMIGGLDDELVLAEVRKAQGRGAQGRGTHGREPQRGADPKPAATPARELPDPLDRRFGVERDVLKLALQFPSTPADQWAELDADDFTHPSYRQIFEVINAVGGPAHARPELLSEKIDDDVTRGLISALTTESLRLSQEPDRSVAATYFVRLREYTAAREIDRLKSRLQRMNPVTEAVEYNRLFGELVALEAHRRNLLEQSLGDTP